MMNILKYVYMYIHCESRYWDKNLKELFSQDICKFEIFVNNVQHTHLLSFAPYSALP